MSDASLGNLFNGLSPQYAILATIAAACAYAIARAFLDRKKPEARQSVAQESTVGQIPIPFWAMAGPVHEVMQTIHDMAEESRKTNAILSDISKTMRDVDKGQAYTHRMLEVLFTKQELQEVRRPIYGEEDPRDSRPPRRGK